MYNPRTPTLFVLCIDEEDANENIKLFAHLTVKQISDNTLFRIGYNRVKADTMRYKIW